MKKDKIGEWGKTAFYFFVLLLIHILFSKAPIDFKGTSIGVVMIFILGIVAIGLFVSMLGFFFQVIIHQLKNKQTFWGVVNILLIIISLINSFNEWGIYSLLPLAISTALYYFIYINPSFWKKLIEKKK